MNSTSNFTANQTSLVVGNTLETVVSQSGVLRKSLLTSLCALGIVVNSLAAVTFVRCKPGPPLASALLIHQVSIAWVPL